MTPSEWMRLRWQDPDYRARQRAAISAGMRGKPGHPAPSDCLSKMSRRLWADPAYRERHRAGMMRAWARRREYQRLRAAGIPHGEALQAAGFCEATTEDPAQSRAPL